MTAPAGRYRALVDVRIGVTQAPRELSLELADDERDETIKTVEAALSGAVDVLWLTDKRGRGSRCPRRRSPTSSSARVDGDRRIGFGG